MATKAEKEHMNRVAALGCIACRLLDRPGVPASIHHVREYSGRRDHMKVLPLCHIHHQTGMFDIAVHISKKRFEDKFGTQQELLKMVDSLIKT